MNSFTCTCAAGYTGSICQTDIDDCSSSLCQNGGTCVVSTYLMCMQCHYGINSCCRMVSIVTHVTVPLASMACVVRLTEMSVNQLLASMELHAL